MSFFSSLRGKTSWPGGNSSATSNKRKADVMISSSSSQASTQIATQIPTQTPEHEPASLQPTNRSKQSVLDWSRQHNKWTADERTTFPGPQEILSSMTETRSTSSSMSTVAASHTQAAASKKPRLTIAPCSSTSSSSSSVAANSSIPFQPVPTSPTSSVMTNASRKPSFSESLRQKGTASSSNRGGSAKAAFASSIGRGGRSSMSMSGGGGGSDVVFGSGGSSGGFNILGDSFGSFGSSGTFGGSARGGSARGGSARGGSARGGGRGGGGFSRSDGKHTFAPTVSVSRVPSLPYPPKEPVSYAMPLIQAEFDALSSEQKAALIAIVVFRLNVFATGSAGVGKTYLIALVRRCLNVSITAVTASTGLAAVNIGGGTLHSWAGVGLADETAEDLAAKMKPDAVKRWKTVETLLVDEISMISAELLEKLDHVGRIVRNKLDQPFGGLQVVLFGDMLQLPPVKAILPAFLLSTWNVIVPHEILLAQVFRQKEDPIFMSLLQRMRVGQITNEDERLLRETGDRSLPTIHGVEPTRLFALCRQVQTDNDTKLKAIQRPAVCFISEDGGKSVPHVELLKKNCPALGQIYLKVGCQVILLKNLDTDRGLCNGRCGVVVELVAVASRDLKHSSEWVIPDQYAQLGTSRQTYEMATSANHDQCGTVVGDVQTSQAQTRFLPRVRFDNGVTMVIEPDVFKIEVMGEMMAQRCQIPLMLSWSLTVHRAQGLTLTQVDIESRKFFEKSQLYVAVSRSKTLKGLRLRNFDKEALQVDERAVKYYQDLEKSTHGVVSDFMNSVVLRFR